MHAMLCLWLLFAFVMFIAEPFILHRYLHRWASAKQDVTFACVHRAYWGDAERDHDSGRGRRQPEMADLLTIQQGLLGRVDKVPDPQS